MAINKNFVVKNGLEVSNNLIYADADISSVGVGTTVVEYNFHVIGGIGATDINVTGFVTTGSLSVSGDTTFGNVTATSIGVTSLNVSGIATINNSIVSGVSTIGNVFVGTAGTTIATLNNKVGIGTTNALHRFQVGSANTTGFTTTTSGLFVITYDGKVGVQTGQPSVEHHVFGNQIVTGVVTATTFNGQINSGVSTITTLDVTNLNVTSADVGISTVDYLSGTNLNYSGISTLGNVVVGAGLTDLVVTGDVRVTGILTVGTSSITLDGNTDTITVGNGVTISATGDVTAGIITASRFIGRLEGTAISADTVGTIDGFINVGIVTYISGTNLDYSGIGSITTLDTTVATIDYSTGTNLDYSGIGTVSGIKIQNGQIQAVSGIATFYGDGSNLSGVSYGIGIRSDGSTIAGSGVTVINFTGSGISTVTANSGIATIYVEGGGGVMTPTEIVLSEETSSSTPHYLTFAAGSGTRGLKVDTSLLSYVPSTNAIHANLTGTATTATLATTSTNANNINISAITSADTVTSVVLVANQSTGNQSPFIDSGLQYNANTNTLTATTFSGNATSATNATNATNTEITNETSSASTHYITFVSGTSGNQSQKVDSTGLTYIPSTNTLTADITGNAQTVTVIPNLTGDVTSSGTVTAIAPGVIVNNDISASASIAVSKLAASTISGVTLGNNLATLTRGTYLTGSNYNGNGATTWAVDATSANTGSKVVARDVSGNFSANVITCVDLNSTSDINLKDDIRPFENALLTVNQLNGVHFTWKKDNRKSIGVIAQEIEKVLPELVNEIDDTKTVNYNGLIGVLIEAIKELNVKVEYLESKL